MDTYSFDASQELFSRAVKVIPNGIYGHTSPALTVPGSYPYYAVRAEGAHYWDMDGNRYIDWMCAYGPMALGYNHPKVEEAATRQRELGDTLNHPAPVMVKLAEKMVEISDTADWAVFGKNGSDMTSWSLQVAREHTGRDKIIMCKGAYHGAHAWCTPGHGGLTQADRINVLLGEYNNLQSIKTLFENNPDDVAAIILTPFHHPAFGDMVMPEESWYPGIRKLCDEYGALLIIDDVRAGFRLHMGGSVEYFNGKADLICYSKALGNCYPISACTGRQAYMSAASKVFLTGSFWGSAVSMAAALAALNVMEEEGSIEKMLHIGTLLQNGLKELGDAHGMKLRITGPPSIPFVSFADETDFRRNQLFCAEVTKRGAFFHPHHNWFVSSAHTEDDVKKTLVMADEAMKEVKKHFG